MVEEVLSFCGEITEASEGESKGEVVGVGLVGLEVEGDKVKGWGYGKRIRGKKGVIIRRKRSVSW